MSKQPKNHRGFSLVELVVATAVVSVMILAISSVVVITGVTQRRANNLASATRAGEAKIEQLRSSYSTITLSPPAIDFASELPTQLPGPRTATVTVSEATAGLKKLEVVITYREGAATKTVRLTALVSGSGIGQ